MKKQILFLQLSFTVYFVQAQYCGNSGPGQCTTTGTFVTPGFYPVSSQLPSFVNGQAPTTTLQFKNFNVINFSGNNYTVISLRIDSVGNLPAGLCWASNKANNTFANQEQGCVQINGTPQDSVGEYKLYISVTATVQPPVGPITPVTIDASAAGINYYMRLVDSCQTAPPTDTLQAATFVPYNLPGCLFVDLGADKTACNGSTVALHAITTAGAPPFTYLWQSTGNAVSCDTCPNPTSVISQNSSFIVTVTDSFNTSATDTVTYTVSGAPFNFSITSSGSDTFCLGASTTLRANGSSAYSYQWQRNGNDIAGALDSSYVVSDSTGVYNVFFTGTGCTAGSNAIGVVVHPLPAVSFVLNPDFVCLAASSFTITGESPAGGNFAGIGVSGNIFDPSTAGTGSHVLIYTYMDLNGCTNTARDTIMVNNCLGMEAINANPQMLIYPNPSTGLLTAESDMVLNNATTAMVFDITGSRLPIFFTKEGNRMMADVTQLAAGVYVLKLQANGQQFNSRFVKG